LYCLVFIHDFLAVSLAVKVSDQWFLNGVAVSELFTFSYLFSST